MRTLSIGAGVGLLITGIVAAQQPEQRPQFRSGVEYVEVDTRVVDMNGVPILGLTRQDFSIVEDGVTQTIETFSPVDLPAPATAARLNPSNGLRPDVATNAMTSRQGRTYLIVVDTLFIGRDRTLLTRKFLRDFIDRAAGPDDLIGITTTGSDKAYENFTRDKQRLVAAVDRLAGEYESPTVQKLNDLETRSAMTAPTPRTQIAATGGIETGPIKGVIMDPARRSLMQLGRLIQEMSAAEGGSKSIILVSESLPFNLNGDPTDWSALGLVTDSERLAVAARRGNVPVYTVDPRGLSDGSEDLITVGRVDAKSTAATGDPNSAIRDEVRRGQERLRVIADDTGGVPLVGNDAARGLDRVVTLSSHYYVLGYYSSHPLNGRYHRINVRVNRPEARVLARHGYSGGGDAKTLGLASGIKQVLNAVLPVPELPLLMTAGAFRQAKDRAEVRFVMEGLGSDLSWSPQTGLLAIPMDVAGAAIQTNGTVRDGQIHRLQLTRTADADRVKQFGFRWTSNLVDLKPGHYQIRAAASNGAGREGSVFFELDVPDFSKAPVTMSDVQLASVVAMQRPTLGPASQPAGTLPGPATTLREFPRADTIAIYAEAYDNDAQMAREFETSVAVITDKGEEKSREVGTAKSANGVVPVKARLPLAMLPPGRYTLAVEARRTDNRTLSAGRALPFQIVDAGNK